MNRTHRRTLLTVLALCALGWSVALPLASSADAPRVLTNGQWISDTLIGNSAGAFAYFTINYPGNGNVVTIELRFASADPVVTPGVGLNVYGPNAFVIGRGMPMPDTGGEGALQVRWADQNPSIWLVQVYNYITNYAVGYRIVATGLPPPQATPTTKPEPTAKPSPTLPLIASGSLTGRSAGSFAYYSVPVVAGARDMQLVLNFSPVDATTAKNVGFVVYGLHGEITRSSTTGVVGQRKATLSGKAPGAFEVQARQDSASLAVRFYRVQVYNYTDALTIKFTLRGGALAQ